MAFHRFIVPKPRDAKLPFSRRAPLVAEGMMMVVDSKYGCMPQNGAHALGQAHASHLGLATPLARYRGPKPRQCPTSLGEVAESAWCMETKTFKA